MPRIHRHTDRLNLHRRQRPVAKHRVKVLALHDGRLPSHFIPSYILGAFSLSDRSAVSVTGGAFVIRCHAPGPYDPADVRTSCEQNRSRDADYPIPHDFNISRARLSRFFCRSVGAGACDEG